MKLPLDKPAAQLFPDLAKATETAIQTGKCRSCGDPFTSLNVWSTAGWRETKISGMCEACFNQLFHDY